MSQNSIRDLKGAPVLRIPRVKRPPKLEDFLNGTAREDEATVTEWVKWLTVSARYSQGTNENFFPATGLAPFLAVTSRTNLGLTFRPAPRICFDQTYIFARLSTREGASPVGFAAGTSIFHNHLLRSKLNYQFNRELSLRLILDYNAVLPIPQLVVLSRSKRLTADLLFTDLLNPGTALYVGYTDRYDNLVLDPACHLACRRPFN